MNRRNLLQWGGSVGLTTLGGCLDQVTGARSTDSTTPDSDVADPRSTPDTTQLQYGPAHSGVASTTAPSRVAQRWHTRVDPGVQGLAVGAGRVFAASGGTLVAHDATTGERHWAADVGHDLAGHPAVADGTVYAPTWNGGEGVDRGVVAVDATDGSERWRAIPTVGVSSAVTLADGLVYAGGSLNSEHVVALDRTDGSERWRVEVGQYATTPAVSDGTAYVGGGSEPTVHALGADDGSERWRVEVDAPVFAPPTVVDGTVYVATRGGAVHALAAEDGREQWRFDGGTDVRASLAVTADAVYVPDEGTLRALSLDGTEEWAVGTAGATFAPTVADDSLVVADGRRAVCLDAATGDRRWRRGVPERQRSDMVFTGVRCVPLVADGVVYLAAHGGDLYALHDASERTG